MGGEGQAGSTFSGCSAWERLQWEEGTEASTEVPARQSDDKKKKTHTHTCAQSNAYSALLPHSRTYPRGENGGSTHSESTPRPKSDLKNKRLTPTILMTLRSLDKSKLNARLH